MAQAPKRLSTEKMLGRIDLYEQHLISCVQNNTDAIAARSYLAGYLDCLMSAFEAITPREKDKYLYHFDIKIAHHLQEAKSC